MSLTERTTVTGERPLESPEVERHIHGSTTEDRMLLFGAAVSSLSVVWLLWTQLLPTTGIAGFLVLWLLAFWALYWVVCRATLGRLPARDRVATTVVTLGTAMLLVPLMLILLFVFGRGVAALKPDFFTRDLSLTGTLDAGGGLAHALVGTLQQVSLAVVISVPLGVLTAVFLNEVGGPLRRPVRMFIDAMSGVPSIVAGLFIYAVWIVQFGFSFSGFAAAMALSVLMLPTIARTSEEVLRLVPDGLREASLALGSTEFRTVWSVVLPTARSGLITAVVLGVARVVGETAPLIMTSFGSTAMNANPFAGAQASLPLSVYQLLTNPFAAQQERAYGGAFVLVFIVLLLFSIARYLGRTRTGSSRVRRFARRRS